MTGKSHCNCPDSPQLSAFCGGLHLPRAVTPTAHHTPAHFLLRQLGSLNDFYQQRVAPINPHLLIVWYRADVTAWSGEHLMNDEYRSERSQCMPVNLVLCPESASGCVSP
eukprot:1140086-Pelagomonas_calceolata.AAC.7